MAVRRDCFTAFSRSSMVAGGPQVRSEVQPGEGSREIMRSYRYSRWDGSQDVEPFTAEDVMQEIAEDMLEDGDLKSALRRLMQRGAEFSSGRRMMGLQELLDKLRGARERNLDRYNLGSMFDDIKERLDQVINTERQGINDR